MNLAPYSKAVAGGIVGALAYAIPVVDDGLLISEILSILLAFFTGAGVVYAAPKNAAR